MLRSIKLADYMVHKPVTISAEANLFEAIHLILVNKISGLCVVDDQHRLVGILSELDCLNGVLSAVYNEGAIGKVGDFMATEHLEVAGPHDDIITIASDMLKKKKRRRPVVENGRLVGQITIRQILRAVKEFSAPVDLTERN